MTVSTHVLDASVGAPAAGVSVTLSRRAAVDGTAGPPQADQWQSVEAGVTDPDGRYRFGADIPAGVYRLVFGTGEYFAARAVTAFYPEVTITFTIPEPAGSAAVTGNADHFHVPLLLSPFAYSTYRGS
jgi:5-hydroxyisourate hydrolase